MAHRGGRRQPGLATTDAPTPCTSPYASGDAGAATHNDGSTRDVNLKVGQYLVVVFSHCGGAGTLDTSRIGDVAQVTNLAARSKGGPAVDIRLHGTQLGWGEVRGNGDKGSRGTIAIRVSS